MTPCGWLVAVVLGVATLAETQARERVETARVHVDFPSGLRRDAEMAARVYEESLGDLEARLALSYPHVARLSLYGSDAEFQAAVSGQDVEPWVAAVAIPAKSAILVRGSSPDATFAEAFSPLLRHEICHLLLGEVEAEGGMRIPLWFNEGLAQWAAERLVVPEADVALLDRYGFVLPFVQIEERFPRSESDARIAYLQSESFVRFVIARGGIAAVRETLGRVRRSERFADAFRAATRAEFYDLERRWKEWLREQYSLPYLILKSLPFFAGVALIVIAAFIVRKIRDRRILRRMEEEERAEAGA